ncbi:NAD+ synthase [Aphanothece hegewaldii CCALA 016]|uniref:Glutamine-dependent NAD(+) synthetase n=1 Tax=Aphanothece hegewaldii CCALA 016 TaxID=2107694 RepID=A0A2T1M365_9CHRO|nr:NAD+ synthase [Aphanothece hegewaldii]PSF39284.1 NAD+ synthase [Aphanothece hegewaldii CCALA 016]
MKIAIAQLNPTIGDLEKNAQQILQAAQEAENQGVRLLLTPELSLCGYPPKDLLFNHSFIQKMNKKLEDLAARIPKNIAVLVGIATINPYASSSGEKPLFNSAACLENGEIKQIFSKRLLPTYDVFDEARYFEPGEESEFYKIQLSSEKDDYLSIGVTICEDLWNDELFWGKRQYLVNPMKDLTNLGVDFIVNLSASPYRVSKQKLREAMLSHSAKHYNIPIVYANQIGGNDDLIFDGNSVAFNREGTVICRAKSFETDLVILEFDPEKQDLLPTSIVSLPELEEAEIWSALVLGVKDYTNKCGFTKVILGLSGGIDSSLVAAIATEAVGKENVLGVLMPSPFSSEYSIIDAEKLVNNLGIKSEQLPIVEVMDSYEELLKPIFTGTSFGIAEENLQSRIRGTLLMAIANKFGYLLLSTGNKSEMAVGYCTLYGDMNGGLAVIADVPKTRVYSLCHWLNRNREIIPYNVLIKPPSAELKPDQLDQDSLPPYEILDDIIERFVNEHQSSTEIIQAGHDPIVVQQVVKLITRAEFKRKQAPPGLKITDRAFGTGWRMPIASRWLDQ